MSTLLIRADIIGAMIDHMTNPCCCSRPPQKESLLREHDPLCPRKLGPHLVKTIVPYKVGNTAMPISAKSPIVYNLEMI